MRTLLALLLLAPLHAWSAPDATELLRRMDDATSGFSDQEMQFDLVIVGEEGSQKRYEMTIWQKGHKRLVRFTSGETKGLATLVDGQRVYVYMPGFKKVRRVAQHNMSQSFAGSDFSNEDMTCIRWSDDFDVTLAREDADAWVLEGTPRPGRKVSYARVRLTVAKDGYFQQKVEYFDGSNRLVKRFEGHDLTTWPQGVRRYRTVVMSDPRTGHATEMRLKTFVVDQGLEDRHFSQRTLRWGH